MDKESGEATRRNVSVTAEQKRLMLEFIKKMQYWPQENLVQSLRKKTAKSYGKN